MARLKMVGIINENEIIKYQKYNTNKKMTLINNDKDGKSKVVIVLLVLSILLIIGSVIMFILR